MSKFAYRRLARRCSRRGFFYRRSVTTYRGTNQVQRNIIAAELLRG